MSDFKTGEKEVLNFWEKNKIYEASKKKNAKGKKFYLVDGPPYANGHIHMGTALNKILKDIAMRAQRIQGRDVFDRAGYDTHGLPIEFQVEKEIGSKSKKDIEKYGVSKFVEKCKHFATQHISSMNSEFKNLGVWMDFDNSYVTLSDEYIEAIWSAFKAADEKGLLYLGKYPVHVCTRCGTAVSYNEIEYGKQKDNSVFVKFPLKGEKNKFLIIWTTTPWTLPGNTGVMVNPDIDYNEMELSNGERWIMAKGLTGKIMQTIETAFTLKKEFKGKTMKGWKYENPLSKYLKLNIKKGYEVVLSSRYVTIEDGTGLVHCAPGHGKEDYEVGKEYGLDMPCPVGIDGILTEEAGKYAGKKAREVDAEIIKDLKELGSLVYQMQYEHDYPLCWRDKTPLLMISQPQWFLKISEIQKKLLKENDKIKWTPDYMGLKMKAWLEGIGDWPVSRQRYWGTPLPIWINESGERIVVGSIDELKKLSGEKKIEVHKPGIDGVVIKHKGKTYRRVSEVLDVWFDSGVSSWASLGFPQDKSKMKKYWPADLNLEGRDQFRGWWNSQLILSEILFDTKPMESISVHGMVTDISKRKMSKSVGNVVSPSDVIDKYGRDYLRYYFAKLSKGEDFSYDEKEFDEIRKIITMILNINNFVSQIEKGKEKKAIEDKWIMSRFISTASEVKNAYDSYKFSYAVQKMEDFIVNDLSKKYIKMIRERTDEIYEVLNEIRNGLLVMISPICPFITEKIWRELKGKDLVKEESVHLSDFPKIDNKKMDSKLEKDFEEAIKAIEAGLAERDKVKIGLRWPLASATLYLTGDLDKKFEEIIARQLNVKKIIFKKENESKVELDTTMNEELEAEGYAREIARKIQAERKNAGLKRGELIDLKVSVTTQLKSLLESQINFLKERTNSKKIEFIDADLGGKAFVFTIKDKKIGAIFRTY